MSGNYKRKDHLYSQAKEDGYASRAAYKLLELQKKYKFLKPHSRVLDLGCAPGSWLQVASEFIGPRGRLIGIDLEPVAVGGNKKPTSSNMSILQGDFCSEEMQQRIAELAGGALDVVLSDMSPKLSGVRDRDIVRSAGLVESALLFAQGKLCQGGIFVAKTFPSPEADELYQQFKSDYKKTSRVRLKSSRRSSNEIYFVASGFCRKSE